MLISQAGILVTGATGFVGRRLVDELIGKSAKVRILKQGPLPVPKEWHDKVEIREGDLTLPDTLKGIADGTQIVFHLAGEIRQPKFFDQVNRIGTENLLGVCRQEGVKRFLHMSSVGVIGASGRPGIVDESTPAKPANDYERSKYAGEVTALKYHDISKMEVTVLRPTIIYGEGKVPRIDPFVLMVRLAKAGRLRPLGEGYVNSYVYVGDVVAAAEMLACHPGAGGEIYIVNEPIPLREFMEEVSLNFDMKKLRPLPPWLGRSCARIIKLTGRLGSLCNETVFSMDKLRALGFSLPFGYKEGLRRTISVWRPSVIR